MIDATLSASMSDPDAPRQLRLVLCRGHYCNLSRRADRLYGRLETLVRQMNESQQMTSVKLETANCLSVCGAGPNLIVYPAHDVFNAVELDQLEAILARYVPKPG